MKRHQIPKDGFLDSENVPLYFFNRNIRKRLPERFPDLAGVKLAEAWAGMIDVTPDAVPYVCEAPPGIRTTVDLPQIIPRFS